MNKKTRLAIAITLVAVAGVGLWSALQTRNASPVTSQSATPEQKPKQQVMAQFEEGVHWERIETPYFVGKKSIHEFFWYGSPHSHAFHKEFEKWKTSNPMINVTTVPVTFGAAIVDAQDFYAMKQVGLDDDLIMNYMEYRQSEDWKNGGVAKYLLEQGVSEGAVLKVKMLSRSQNIADQIEANQHLILDGNISGVPGLVISGKYKILLKNLSDSYEDLFALIDTLLTTQP